MQSGLLTSLPSMEMVPASGISARQSGGGVWSSRCRWPEKCNPAWSGMVSETRSTSGGNRMFLRRWQVRSWFHVSCAYSVRPGPRLMNRRARMVPVQTTSVSTVTIRHKPATSEDDP